MMDEERIKQIAAAGAEGAVNLIAFLDAMRRMKWARSEGVGISLSPREVEGMLFGLEALAEGMKREKK